MPRTSVDTWTIDYEELTPPSTGVPGGSWSVHASCTFDGIKLTLRAAG
jgi:hypothetical protein